MTGFTVIPENAQVQKIGLASMGSVMEIYGI